MLYVFVCLCTFMHVFVSVCLSVAVVTFKMREEDVFYEHGFISITAYSMTVIHIPITQLNVTLIGLGYYMILKRSLYTA